MSNTPIKIDKLELCSNEDLKKYITYLQLKPEAEMVEKQIKQLAKEYMKQNGLMVMESDLVKLDYIAPYKRKVADTKKMQEDGILEIYQKETNVSDSVKVTIKWENTKSNT